MCGRVGVFVRNGLVAFERVCQGAESGLTDSKISFPVLILTPVFCFLCSTPSDVCLPNCKLLVATTRCNRDKLKD
jgi:hypothetical protein